MEESKTEDPLQGILEGAINISSKLRLHTQTNRKEKSVGLIRPAVSHSHAHTHLLCSILLIPLHSLALLFSLVFHPQARARRCVLFSCFLFNPLR